MDELVAGIARVAAEARYSGAVRVDRADEMVFGAAYGMANRAHQVPNTLDTQFAIASGSKGFTALVVMSLVEDGALEPATTARSLLGADLPLIDDAVTVEHLLAHRSGIGDYLDEETMGDITDYVMTRPAHELETTEAFLPMLDGHPTAFPADERFAYCNGGYMVLALLAERAGGKGFHDLVRERVLARAGLRDTDYLRSDELPGRAATGYLSAEGLRTNVFHLPVLGNGDGGIYTTTADVHTFWTALFSGRIVSPETVALMVRPRSDVPSESKRYGLGFWLHATTDAVMLEGYDAGVWFRSIHVPDQHLTCTEVSNTSDQNWMLAKYIHEHLPS